MYIFILLLFTFPTLEWIFFFTLCVCVHVHAHIYVCIFYICRVTVYHNATEMFYSRVYRVVWGSISASEIAYWLFRINTTHVLWRLTKNRHFSSFSILSRCYEIFLYISQTLPGRQNLHLQRLSFGSKWHIEDVCVSVCPISFIYYVSMIPSEEGNGNPLRYSCLEEPMDREAWRATVQGVIRVGHNLVTKPSPPPWCRQIHQFNSWGDNNYPYTISNL